MQKGGTVYIMANINNRVLYTGVTANLYFRVLQHKQKINPDSFTAKYKWANWFIMNHIQPLKKLLRKKKNKRWEQESKGKTY